MKRILLLPALALLLFSACKKSGNGGSTSTAKIIFKYKLDSTQARLDNRGQPYIMPVDNSAQSPKFNGISSHYIELAPSEFVALGQGVVLYKAPEVTTGGANAIDFSKSVVKKDGEEFFSIPISSFTPGTYKYLRVSLAYQNYDINIKAGSVITAGTVASFIGFRTYITSFPVKTQNITVNGNKNQGYWAFEVAGSTVQGQAPGTTVPNPIFATSPIPAGSCVVTGPFINAAGAIAPLTITGQESQDIIVTVSLSTNKSFEWRDLNSDGLFEPTAGDLVVDMGVRGMRPVHNK